VKTLWKGKNKGEWGEAELREQAGVYELVAFDGAEGAAVTLTSEQLLDLAYTIYEELG
jgi:hypothetical protein